MDQDTAHTKADKGKGRAEESSETAPSGSSEPSTDENAEFAENAHGDEDQDDGSDRMDLAEDGVPKPDNLRKQIYEKATPHLGKLMENPKDAGATSELNKLNKQIKEQNLKDKLPKKDLENFLIQVPTFAANFDMAKGYYESLQKDPADDIAREKLTNINNILDQLNDRHGYPRTWLITLPPRTGTKLSFGVRPCVLDLNISKLRQWMSNGKTCLRTGGAGTHGLSWSLPPSSHLF